MLSAGRAEELADLLDGTDVNVVEDDVLGPLSPVPVRTLGRRLPDQTIRVQEYCRAFGIDLRTSVIGGARHLVDAAIHQRSGGVASNSRLLQDTLAALLADERAAALALSSHGIVVDVAAASHVSEDPGRQRLRLSLAQLHESSVDELA
ncbi:hypothetical protein [Citricoccus sp. NR2]|uniref:hypothetical protein n=1 Tax=Citricoccus sp. NR2 TaxID=3004095 RepID=UPI0022DDE3E4|nr:hypothetical protein [Citricoccus sp. NR2]WBL20218.1 hypothetical protein O1A05_05925 [Citricoccus sp. NR2]